MTNCFLKKLIFHFFMITSFPVLCFSLPNPATILCTSLKYEPIDGDCLFPNGSRCEQWSFWRGECGKPYHICTLRGGKLDVINNTPICRMEDQLYTWQIKKSSSTTSTQSEWKVVLVPYVSPSNNQTLQSH